MYRANLRHEAMPVVLQHSTDEFGNGKSDEESLPGSRWGSSFLVRVCELPLVRRMQNVYEDAKERNVLLRVGDRTICSSFNTVGRLLDKSGISACLDKPMRMMDASACFILDKVEGKLPIITKTPYEMKLMARQKYDDTMDTVQTLKENTTNRIRDSLEEAKHRGMCTVDSVRRTHYGHKIDRAVESTLCTLDGAVDKYFPEGNEVNNGKVGNGYSHSNGGSRNNGTAPPGNHLVHALHISHKLTHRIGQRVRDGSVDVVESVLSSPPVAAYHQGVSDLRQLVRSVKQGTISMIHAGSNSVKHAALRGYVMLVEAVGSLVTVSHSILLKVLPASLHEPVNLTLNKGVDMLNKHVHMPYVDADE